MGIYCYVASWASDRGREIELLDMFLNIGESVRPVVERRGSQFKSELAWSVDLLSDFFKQSTSTL